MDPRISFVTLGVTDLERATRFYADVLRLPQKETPPEVAFFDLGGTYLSLWARASLAEDARVPDDGRPGAFAGFALAHNVHSIGAVDRIIAEVEAAGGRVTKPGTKTDWGGYAGYFADPDGFLWEIAYNPYLPHLATDG
ncbi:MAG TPA: VOC family protein [Longimicrobium sp.]|nr:VOC family protein [Longimicrobium sp.]